MCWYFQRAKYNIRIKSKKKKKRAKTFQLYKALDKRIDFSNTKIYGIEINETLDILLSQLTWRYDQLVSNFDLTLIYKEDVNATIELSSEIWSFKMHATTILPNINSASSMELLNLIHDYESFTNIDVAIRIFLTIPVTVAFCEQCFSKLY